MNAADQFLNRLSILYGPPETHDEDGFLREYRAVLAQFSTQFLEPACDLIRDTHTRKSWPTPGEVREALNKIAARGTVRPVDWDAVEADRKAGWKFEDLARAKVDDAVKERMNALVAELKRKFAEGRVDERDPLAPDWVRGQRDGFHEMQRNSRTGLHVRRK